MSLDYRETLRNVCAAAVDTVADICLLDLGAPWDVDLVAFAHRNPQLLEELRGAGAFLTRCEGRPRHPSCDVIATGKSVFVPDMDDAYVRSHATSEEHAQFMRRMDYRSMIIVPVISQVHAILGALTLVRNTSSGERYDDEALLFAEDLGRRCGSAIAKAQLYSQTMEASIRLQRAALPRALPVRPGISLDAYYEPAASEIMVGGDWYDAFNLRDGRLGISIGDVAGHGIDAAAIMGRLRDALRAVLYADSDVVKALAIADYLVTEEFPDDRCATALLAILDPDRLTLILAAAGHPGPFVWDPHEQAVIDPFQNRGLPLGVRGLLESPCETREVKLKKDSFAVFFTDGLLEWQHDYLNSERSLAETLARRDIREAPNPAIAIRHGVVSGRNQDDIAVLTLRVH